ncbi:MAG: RagB/SusD family nutrient uptake outer membrane protein [Janthinobacterium lividum]
MKKNNIKYTLYAGLMLLLSACNKQLDLKPTQSIETSQALLTAKDVQITLVGAYSNLNAESLYGGVVFLAPDLLGTAGQGSVDWTGTYQSLTEMTNQSITVTNTYVASIWLTAYQNLNQINNVIANLDKVTVTADRDRIEGEAKFLRGMIYFDLVRLYGRAWNDGDPTTNLGVPLILMPTASIDASSVVARSTVSQVYTQVLSDLTTAEAKLPASNGFYANKYAAAAILSRVYLQKIDYPNAVKEANNVISSGAFSLTATYAAEFPFANSGPVHYDNTSEDIFAVQITSQQGTNAQNEFYGGPSYGGRGDAAIGPNFPAEFEAGDARATFFYNDGGSLYSSKFQNTYGNVKITRLAEMYLTRAEANLRSNTMLGDSPVNDINKVRVRAGLTPLANVSLAQILTERRHELTFEGGFFLHDANRTMQTAVGTQPWNSPKLVFPIPQREIIANTKLVQNSGY